MVSVSIAEPGGTSAATPYLYAVARYAVKRDCLYKYGPDTLKIENRQIDLVSFKIKGLAEKCKSQV